MSGRSALRRALLPATVFAAAALLGGCVAYPDYGYNYGYGYAAPVYGYGYGYGYPYASFSFGGTWGGWGDHDWHGGGHHWRR